MIKQLDKLIKEYQSLLPLDKEVERKLNEKFRLEFNYNSNHLEGNTLTYGETKLLLLSDQTKGNHEMREYEEMKAHDFALLKIKEEASEIERPLTEQFIKELNQIILVKPFWKDAITPDKQSTRRLIKVGDYKEQPNHVIQANGEIFEYVSPQDTPIKMAELVKWYNEEVKKEELSPIEIAALLHYRYILIHPFDDGNGRIARLLVNYVLYKNHLPPVIIKTKDKKNYLRALQQADAGTLQAFIDYMIQQLAWSLELYKKAAKGGNIEEQDDWEKKLSLLKKGLGNKNNKGVKKSEEILEKLYKEVLDVFFVLYEEKISKFDDLFMSGDVSIYINGDDYDDYDEDFFYRDNNIKNVWNNFQTDLEDDNFKFNHIDISIFNLVNYFNKLREKPYKEIEFEIELYFSFGKNAYGIEYNDKAITKLYNDFITQEEMQKIISEIAKDLFDKIEKAIHKD